MEEISERSPKDLKWEILNSKPMAEAKNIQLQITKVKEEIDGCVLGIEEFAKPENELDDKNAVQEKIKAFTGKMKSLKVKQDELDNELIENLKLSYISQSSQLSYTSKNTEEFDKDKSNWNRWCKGVQGLLTDDLENRFPQTNQNKNKCRDFFSLQRIKLPKFSTNSNLSKKFGCKKIQNFCLLFAAIVFVLSIISIQIIYAFYQYIAHNQQKNSYKDLVPLRDFSQSHNGWVTSITVNQHRQPNYAYPILTGGEDGYVRYYHYLNGSNLDLNGRVHNGWIPTIVSTSSQILITGGEDGIVKQWHLYNRSLDKDYGKIHNGWILSMAVSTDEHSVFIGGEDGNLVEYNIPRRELTKYYGVIHDRMILSMVTIHDYQFTAGEDGHIKIFSTKTKEYLYDFGKVHSSLILTLVASSDGKYQFSSSSDGQLKQWDIYRRKLVTDFGNAHIGVLRGIAQSDDNKVLFTGGFDRRVKAWNVENGSLLVDYGEVALNRITCMARFKNVLYIGGAWKGVQSFKIGPEEEQSEF